MNALDVLGAPDPGDIESGAEDEIAEPRERPLGDAVEPVVGVACCLSQVQSGTSLFAGSSDWFRAGTLVVPLCWTEYGLGSAIRGPMQVD